MRALLALLACLLPAPAVALDAAGWLALGRLSDGLGPWRERLHLWGVDIGAAVVSEIQGNPAGGERRGIAATTSSVVEIDLDLDTLLHVPGARAEFSGMWRTGENLSHDDIGNIFIVSEAFGNETIRLETMALGWRSQDGALDVLAGRLAVGDDFATSDLFCYFLQSAFCGNPLAIPYDAQGFTAAPVAAWGGRAVGTAGPFALRTGVYQSDATVGDPSNHGVDFSIPHDDGVFAIGQVDWFPAGPEAGHRLGLGGWYDSSRYTGVISHRNPNRTRATHVERSGNAGVYAIGETTVWRDAVDPAQQLRAFGALTVTRETLNLLPIMLAGGGVWTGLVPGRDSDATALGAAVAWVGEDTRESERNAQAAGRRVRGPQTWELVFALGHRVDMTPWWRWLYLEPDVQYIVRPGGTGAVPNALVLGVQIGVTL